MNGEQFLALIISSFFTITVVFFVDAFMEFKKGSRATMPIKSFFVGVIAGAAVWFSGSWSFSHLGNTTFLFLAIILVVLTCALIVMMISWQRKP